MGLEEFLEWRRLRSIGTARREREQEVAEFSRGRRREAVIGMRDEIGVGAIGKMELTARPRGLALGSVSGIAGTPAKSENLMVTGTRRVLQVGRLAETGGVRARREFAFEHHALGIRCPVISLLAEHGIERIDQLRRRNVGIGLRRRLPAAAAKP